ncbi:MAG: nucleoside 2-deoxyribosyltransferase [Pseudomonadota bacterium]
MPMFQSHPPKIYLAGPDVFFPNPKEIAERKKKICQKYGFEGVFPLDVEIKQEGEDTPFDIAAKISQSNENLMDNCALLIANLTPFRGVSVDAGTAFEAGYMRAQDKPVLGYTNITADYKERVHTYYQSTTSTSNAYDPDQQGVTEVEDFGLAENLMIEIAIHNSKGHVVRQQVQTGEAFVCLQGFEICVQHARNMLKENVSYSY